MPVLIIFFLTAVSMAAQARPEFTDGDTHGDPPYLLEDGWTPLLNGRDISGWHGLGSEPNEWFTARGILWERLLGPTRLTALGGLGFGNLLLNTALAAGCICRVTIVTSL